jgi:hypothetical protein
MWFSPLQEAYYGKGLYIECSLDIIRKFKSEPLAAILWRNIFDRLKDFKAPEYKPLYVLNDKKTEENLKKQGIVCNLTDNVPEKGILLVTNASNMSSVSQEKLDSFIKNGNLLWIHARKGSDVSILEKLASLKIKIAKYPRDWRKREVRRTKAGRETSTLSGINSAAIYARESVDDIWTVEGKNALELATGGAVVESPLGKGEMIIERIAWDKPGNLIQQQWADHFLHSFVTNIGGEIDIFRYKKRRIFKSSDFVQLDLRKVCNRAFRDDQANDGKGGWTDQGENDLRGMSTGKQTYHQVVFEIIDQEKNDNKSCLVLHSEKHAPACIKATEEIPVNCKAKALFFLHTAAWYSSRTHTGKALIKYIVTYEDGSSVSVPALGGKNIKDWWTPGNCDESLGVALLLKTKTEADQIARRRGLQLQEWLNPHPEKAIKSIRIESGETGAIPIVIGISLLKN